MSEFYPKRPACRLSKNTTQSNVASPVQITFEVVDFDTYGSMANLASNRIDIPVSGLYLLHAGIQWDSGAGGTGSFRFPYFGVNGSAQTRTRKLAKPCGSAVAPRYTIFALHDLTKGDNVTFHAQNNSGGTADVSGVSATFLSAVLLDRSVAARFGVGD